MLTRGVYTAIEDLSASDRKHLHGARVYRSVLSGAPTADEALSADADFVQTIYRLNEDGSVSDQAEWD